PARAGEGGGGRASPAPPRPGGHPPPPAPRGAEPPPLVAPPAGLQPPVADRRHRLAHGRRIQDGRGGDEEERLVAAAVALKGDVPDRVEPIEQREGAVVVLAELAAGPGLREHAGRGGRGGAPPGPAGPGGRHPPVA